jgi:hypothetical protein
VFRIHELAIDFANRDDSVFVHVESTHPADIDGNVGMGFPHR